MLAVRFCLGRKPLVTIISVGQQQLLAALPIDQQHQPARQVRDRASRFECMAAGCRCWFGRSGEMSVLASSMSCQGKDTAVVMSYTHFSGKHIQSIQRLTYQARPIETVCSL